MLYLLILARVLSSWVPGRLIVPGSLVFTILKMLYTTTEPILSPIRNRLPKTGMFDLAPLVAIIGINMIQWLAGKLLI
ncbi:MAG: YggT family protein [Dehalococcoidia bacterium]